MLIIVLSICTGFVFSASLVNNISNLAEINAMLNQMPHTARFQETREDASSRKNIIIKKMLYKSLLMAIASGLVVYFF